MSPANIFFAARIFCLEHLLRGLPLDRDWVMWEDGPDWGHVGLRQGRMYATRFDPALGRHVDLEPDPVRQAEYSDYCERLREAARRRLAR